MNDDTTQSNLGSQNGSQQGNNDFSAWQQMPEPKAKADVHEDQNSFGPGMSPPPGFSGGAGPLPPPQFGGSAPTPPAGTFPPAGTAAGSTAGDPQPVKKSDYIFGKIFQKFDTNITIPEHTLKFDQKFFLRLLAGSISLTKDEKLKIIKSIPKLSQYQIDELIKILQEEQRKFAELSEKHSEQLEKLEKKHAEEWKDIEVGTKAEEKGREDEAKAEEIRKNLGL